MDEDQILQSIIADPKLTDPSIDVSQFRQTTETALLSEEEKAIRLRQRGMA